MGMDVRIWIHKEDLKELDLFTAIEIIDKFTGRWQYCITDRFVIEEDNKSKLTLEEIKEHVIYNSDVPQKSRDILKRLENLRLIFQSDYEEEEFHDYFELRWFMDQAWNKAKVEGIK